MAIRSIRRPRVLYATPILRHPPTGGPVLRVENSIKALNRMCELTVYCRIAEDKIGGAPATAFYRRHCRRFLFSPHVVSENPRAILARRAVNFVSRRLLGRVLLPVTYHGPWEEFVDVIAAAVKVKADVIWLGYGNISYPLLRYLKEHSPCPVVLDTDSVWSRFLLRGLPYATDEAERTRIATESAAKEEEETWGTRLADVTTAVSEVDAAYYRGLAARPSQVHLFSNVIDVDTYARPPPRDPRLPGPYLYLAGSFFEHSPMEKAARWVLREVWPQLCAARPSLTFEIVGRGSDRYLADVREPGVTVHGELASVLPLLAHADVVLVPLQYESGTRFKILEAGACGRAVVSTTLGAEGLPVQDGVHGLLADTAESFAAAIERVLADRDLAARLGRALRTMVETDFGLTRLTREATAILQFMEREGKDD